MPLIAARAALTATGAQSVVSTATEYWICQNTAASYDSGADRLRGRRGTGTDMLRGTTSGSDTTDPTFSTITPASTTYSCLSFDGGDHLQHASNSTLNVGTGDWTWLFVVSLTTVSPFQYLMNKSTSADGYSGQVSASKLRNRCVVSSTAASVTDTPTLTNDTLHTCAYQATSGNLKVALDGTILTASTALPGTQNLDNAASLYIGSLDATDSKMTGKLVGFGLWKRSLTGAEMTTARGEILTLAEV